MLGIRVEASGCTVRNGGCNHSNLLGIKTSPLDVSEAKCGNLHLQQSVGLLGAEEDVSFARAAASCNIRAQHLATSSTFEPKFNCFNRNVERERVPFLDEYSV